MADTADLDALRERLKAFLTYLKPKMIAAGADADRLSQLRNLSDVRVRQFSVGRPRITPEDLAALLADPRTGRFDAAARELGLLAAGHLAVDLPPLGIEMGYLIEACLSLQVIGADAMRTHVEGFVRQAGPPTPARPPSRIGPAVTVAGPTPLPPAVQKLLGAAKDLWSVPPALVKIQQMLSSPSTAVDRIATEIELQPALAAECRRWIGALSPGSPVSSLKRAAVSLGFPLLHRMVTFSAILGRLGRPAADDAFDPGAFWSHSLWVAHAAALVARATKIGQPEDHFAVGLAHDLGRLVLVKYFRKHLAASRGNEAKTFGTTHAEIGASVAERWGLPPAIAEAARHHTAPLSTLEEVQLPRESVVAAGSCALSRSALPTADAEAWCAFLRLPPDRLAEVRLQASRLAAAAIKEALA
jgi:HD-like signal output (HDOD) protein